MAVFDTEGRTNIMLIPERIPFRPPINDAEVKIWREWITAAVNAMAQSSDYYLRVAKGEVPGTSAINKFGNNPSSTTGDDVWTGGGVYPFYPSIAVAVDIVSTSTDDDSGGTGAIQVTVQGLDENWDEQTETVTLNGTGVVQLTNTYVRMFRAFVLEAGSSNTNIGNITCYARATGSGVTAGDVSIHIGAGNGQTQQTIYTVPNGKTAYFIKGYVGMATSDKTAEDTIFRWLMKFNNGINGAWLTQGEIGLVNLGSGHWQYEYGVPAGPLPEKTDIRIAIESASGTFDTVGGYDLVLVDN